MSSVILLAVAIAGDPAASPIPADRAALHATLAASRSAKPRLPMPEISKDEEAQLGRFARFNNLRFRYRYLPEELRLGDFVREKDPAMTLPFRFKTELFWIVSRLNHCEYCLGHQEQKLHEDGLSDEEIARLDLDWASLSDRERRAFEAARKLTYEPHRFGPADFAELRKSYSENEALEVLFTVSNNNATNRWTGALAIPQEWFEPPAKESAAGATSQLAPLVQTQVDVSAGKKVDPLRPSLESADVVEKQLAAARARQPLVPLVEPSAARQILGDLAPAGDIPAWIRLLVRFPLHGAARVKQLLAAQRVGDLDPAIKAQIAYVAAREDRAWYAVDVAQRRLDKLGWSPERIASLGGSLDAMPAGDRTVLAFARKLTSAPAAIFDTDVEGVRKALGDKKTAEVIHQVCNAAFFDRFTEAARLPLDPPATPAAEPKRLSSTSK